MKLALLDDAALALAPLLLFACRASPPVRAPQDQPAPPEDSVAAEVTEDPARLPWTVELQVGLRALQEETYGTVENHFSFGVLGATRPSGWPVELELAFFSTEEEREGSDLLFSSGVDIEGSNFELAAGVRYVLVGPARISLALGAGLAYVRGRFRNRADGEGASDTDIAPYGHAALLFPVGPGGHFGFDVRTTVGLEHDLGLGGTDADYVQVSMVYGLSF